VNDIVTPSEFSRYSYDQDESLVYRDSIIETIKIFSNEFNVVYVQGGDGWGKTSLLQQYVEKNKEQCITLCIDPNSKHQYFEDSIIRDLYVQLKTYLGDLDRIHDEDITEKDLIRTISTTEYRLKSEKKKLYFVIDGLDEIPTEDKLYTEAIAKALPIGSKNISFIISIKDGGIKKLIKSKDNKEYAISLFSYDETKAYIPTLEENDIRSVQETFGGVPEKLSIIKDLISQGVSIDDILDNNTASTEGLFEKEWSQYYESLDICKKELGIIAFSESKVSLDDLKNLYNASTQSLDELKKISFIKSDEGNFKFKSNGFKKFAKSKLESIKSESINQIIKNLEEKPSSVKTITALASFYKEIGDKDRVVTQLSNENLELLLSDTKSINAMLRQIELGINCATNNDSELLRFCYLKSLLNGITTSNLLKSEMKQLLLSDNKKAALDLANSASSNEERLQMLCLIASDYKEKKIEIPENIEKFIDDLYQDLTPSTLGVEKTIDIAMDLFSFNPDYALSLINKIDEFDSGGQNKSDYAFFRFTLEAVRKDPEKLESSIFESQSISEKKRNAIGAIKHFKEGKPVEKVLEGLEEIESPGDRLFLLRNWIKASPERNGNNILAEYMLDLALKTTDFSINATFCAELSQCLKYIEKAEDLNKLYIKIKPQLETIKPLGPTMDYVKVLISLHEAQIKLGISGCDDSDSPILLFITSEIKDKSIALACLCLLEEGKSTSLGTKDKIKDLKNGLLNDLLNYSANQFEVLQEALQLQSKRDFDTAIEWASKLNTQYRRCEAYSYVISQYCDYESKDKTVVSIDRLCQCARKIQSIKYRSHAVSDIITYFSRQESPSKNDFNKLYKLAFRSKAYSTLCNFSARLLDLGIKKNVITDDSKTKIKEKLSHSWSNLDGECEKIDHGFKISNLHSSSDSVLSDAYKQYAIKLRSEASIDNDKVIEALTSAIDLSTRALYLLVKSGSDEESDTSSILEDILKIPSERLKAKQLARLASVFQKNDRDADARKIIQDHIQPLIDDVNGDLNDTFADVFYLVSPVIYKSNQKLWDRYVEPIKNDNKEFFDQLVVRCIRYIMNNCLLGDPYDPIKNHVYNINYSDIELLISLIELIHEDGSSFYHLNSLAIAIKTLHKNRKLSTAQLNDIYGRFERISKENYPKDGYIDHDGYKILAEGLCLFLKDIKSKPEWESLVSKAESVPNISDTSYILCVLAELMPSSLRNDRLYLLEISYRTVEKIPSYIDRLGRYECLAEASKGIDKQFAKKCIKRDFC
jgi:hypothetical protein